MRDLEKYDSQNQTKGSSNLNSLEENKEDIDFVPEESRVGKRLSDLT